MAATPKITSARLTRRRFLTVSGAGLAIGGGALAAPAVQACEATACRDAPRETEFVHAHTGERFKGVYFENGAFVTAALASADWVLRDVTVDKSMMMSNELIDLLGRLKRRLGDKEIVVTSGYRSRATNEALRRVNRRAARRSLHIEGKAVDFYSPGVPARRLAELAVAEAKGGVGYYPRQRFIHVDVGPVRYWRG